MSRNNNVSVRKNEKQAVSKKRKIGEYLKKYTNISGWFPFDFSGLIK
ncbi:MAG: hypothetical protein HC846_01510 [Blastocatellia bacterium]|nr:hypothetical protein [Blastocatellia bacterium]